MNHEELTVGFKKLNLPHMGRSYVELAKIAEKDKHTYEQYLSMLVATELRERQATRVKRYIFEAKIPLPKTFENFNFSLISGITEKQFKRLILGDFLKEAANLVFYGEFGVGKSHLAMALTQKLCLEGFRCYFTSVHNLIADLLKAKQDLTLTSLFKKLDRYDLITCDELGYTAHDQAGADLFFQLISQRAERKSFIITTNLTYSEWDKVFISPLSTTAAVDRIIHNCETFNIRGPSGRKLAAEKRQASLTQQPKEGII
jgi:DNA replication protein DnaC